MPYNPGIPLLGRCPREKSQMWACGNVDFIDERPILGKSKCPSTRGRINKIGLDKFIQCKSIVQQE